MNLKQLQKDMHDWRKRKGLSTNKEDVWYNIPILMEEVGEFCEAMTKGVGDKAEELADIVIISFCIGDLLGIDMEKAINQKMIKLEEKQLFIVDGHQRVTHPDNMKVKK